MMYKSVVEGKGGITAKVVADSIANDVRLTTLELRYPRFIHSEFMTHRQFSRNASSSRAIPVKKMIEQVENDPAMPIHWGKNRPGMQAKEECDESVYFPCLETPHDSIDEGGLSREDSWMFAAESAAEIAGCFEESGYHKQIVNRLLEPFQFISVVVTATEWENFFKLRLHEDAQPEIYELARVMKEAMDNSHDWVYLSPGQYHTPYVLPREHTGQFDDRMISAARCARVSYLNHDKTDPDYILDYKLAERLLEAGHMSPFEHIATPMNWSKEDTYIDVGSVSELREEWDRGTTHMDKVGNLWSGNLRGWVQYRQLVQ